MTILTRVAGTTLAAFLAGALTLTGNPGSAVAEIDVRLEGGFGVQGGDPDIEFGGVEDELDLDTGYIAGGALWLDRILTDYISAGAQYLRFDGADFSESGTGTILGATVTGSATIEPTIDAFLVNIALRKPDSWWHPYIGGGIGVARVDADASVSATIVVNGTTFVGVGSVSDEDTVFAGQIFGGIDFDVHENVYLGANGRYFLANAQLFEADVDFRNWAFMGVIGIRF